MKFSCDRESSDFSLMHVTKRTHPRSAGVRFPQSNFEYSKFMRITSLQAIGRNFLSSTIQFITN